ncbi:MAG: hypothetical protein IJ110_01495 [Lachnospiraceae bacterium]|nr:hypothetical protein [Lachnospiraceae bacterium]
MKKGDLHRVSAATWHLVEMRIDELKDEIGSERAVLSLMEKELKDLEADLAMLEGAGVSPEEVQES